MRTNSTTPTRGEPRRTSKTFSGGPTGRAAARSPRRPWTALAISASCVVQPKREAQRAFRQRRRDAHGVEHMRALDLARRAGGARRNRDTREIDRTRSRPSRTGGPARRCSACLAGEGPRTEHDDIRPHRQQPVEQPRRARQRAECPRSPAKPLPLPPPAPCRRCRRHSRCRSAAASPGRARTDQRLCDHKTLAVEDDRADALGPADLVGRHHQCIDADARRCRAGFFPKAATASQTVSAQAAAPSRQRQRPAAGRPFRRSPPARPKMAPGSASSASSASSITTRTCIVGSSQRFGPASRQHRAMLDRRAG